MKHSRLEMFDAKVEETHPVAHAVFWMVVLTIFYIALYYGDAYLHDFIN